MSSRCRRAGPRWPPANARWPAAPRHWWRSRSCGGSRAGRRPRNVPWAWAAAGAALGIAWALIAFAPARWVAGAVEQASRGQVLLLEPRGTVWAGTARLVLTGGQGSTDAAALPGRIGWQLGPRWDGAAAGLQSECCARELPMR